MQGLVNNNWFHLNDGDILHDFKSSYAYEVIRLINARPLFLDLHYQRLVKTCQSLKITPPELIQIISDIEKLAAVNQIQNNNIKIALDQYNNAVFPIPSIYPSKQDYQSGVSCSLLFEERENPEIKAFQTELREKSNKQISQQDIYESVLVNSQEYITEGSRSNIFFIQGQNILTAPDHMVLAGITRMKVLDLCKDLNLNVHFKSISIENLNQIDAAFICGTSPGVLAIRNIDEFNFDVKNPILEKVHNSYHSEYLSYFQF